MTDKRRVITANLPLDLACRMDEIVKRIDRTRSWILRQAVSEWLAEGQRRHELTLEGMRDFEEGRVFSQEQVEAMVAERKLERGQQK